MVHSALNWSTFGLIFFVCFICLNLLNQNPIQADERSQLLPLVVNATEPYLITGNIPRLQPELEQLVLGTSIERIDVHGADSLLLASIRNLDLIRPTSSNLHEFSSVIVLDDALAATIILQEYLTSVPPRTWPNLLISFACALAGAIEKFEGGVVIISHNDEFCQQLCPETWVVERDEDGISRPNIQGDAEWMANAVLEKVDDVQVEQEMIDAAGNVTKTKVKKKLSKKDTKKMKAKIMSKISSGLELDSDEEGFAFEHDL